MTWYSSDITVRNSAENANISEEDLNKLEEQFYKDLEEFGEQYAFTELQKKAMLLILNANKD